MQASPNSVDPSAAVPHGLLLLLLWNHPQNHVQHIGRSLGNRDIPNRDVPANGSFIVWHAKVGFVEVVALAEMPALVEAAALTQMAALVEVAVLIEVLLRHWRQSTGNQLG